MTASPSRRRRWLIALLAALLPATLWLFLQPAPVARGKMPAAPLLGGLSPEQQAAQDLALADPRVQVRTAGHRAEVFGVRAVGMHFPAGLEACATHDCRQVEIYLYDENATVLALVDLTSAEVRAVYDQPGIQPGANQRVTDLAIEIARNSPAVLAELGRRPARDDLHPMDGGIGGTACPASHLCLVMAIQQGNSVLWVEVDVVDEAVVGLVRAAAPDAPAPASSGGGQALAGGACPEPGTVNRDGWSLGYETTANDGLRLYAVTFFSMPVLTSAKLVEWHADYGLSGFQDSTGCLQGGGGYTIYPYGETVLTDLVDGAEVIGFELTQDFRMDSWGANCNYRYDQRYQFYLDGSFRIVGAAYGKGCSTGSLYRPLMRIDLAVAGDDADSIAMWNGSAWISQTTETWWSQDGPYTPEGYKWRVTDAGGRAYYLEPGRGQFGDAGRGDNAYVYAIQHHPEEGDANLGAFNFPPLAECCQDDHQQGPHLYLDGESIAGENLVLWYVPQTRTIVDTLPPTDFYCWTVSGEPSPETYPCPTGPMFRPGLVPQFEHSAATGPADTIQFTNTTVGFGGLSLAWDFGDGLGVSSLPTPTHQYTSYGSYEVSLTVTDSLGSGTVTQTVWVGDPPVAEFQATFPDPVLSVANFVNTSTGTQPLSYLWSFGDGLTSTLVAPTHTYSLPGPYTVTLTATNPVASSAMSRLVVSPWRRWLPRITLP